MTIDALNAVDTAIIQVVQRLGSATHKLLKRELPHVDENTLGSRMAALANAGLLEVRTSDHPAHWEFTLKLLN